MANFSIEAVVFGRNDDYEPNWAEKLQASLAHNRRLFEQSRVDFRVAFVEWNPPADRPLLAPMLVDRFQFVRVIVVDAEVHQALCESPNLKVMTNYPFNVGLRSSTADFTLITCGDEFYGSTLASRIINGGLRPGCLYRAERVNIREDIDFTTASIAVLEDPRNIVSIDTCSEPPYNQPPFTNASGDFMMLDAGTMAGIRGMDESIRSARLHTDSRLATTAMIAGADCELLGQTFHINHRQTYRNNVKNYPGDLYKWDVGLPYINSSDWGLSGFNWQDIGERVQRVSLPTGGAISRNRFEHPSAAVRDEASRVAGVLARIRADLQPEEPLRAIDTKVTSIKLSELFVEPHWESLIKYDGNEVRLETGPTQWSYAATFYIEDVLPDERWHWILMDIAVHRGAVGIGLRVDSDFKGERYVAEGSRSIVAVPVERGADMVIIRNIDASANGSVAVIYDVRFASQVKRVVAEV